MRQNILELCKNNRMGQMSYYNNVAFMQFMPYKHFMFIILKSHLWKLGDTVSFWFSKTSNVIHSIGSNVINGIHYWERDHVTIFKGSLKWFVSYINSTKCNEIKLWLIIFSIQPAKLIFSAFIFLIYMLFIMYFYR